MNRVVENLFESANSSFLEELHLNKTSLKRLEHVVEEIVSIIATPGGPPSVVTVKNYSGSSGYGKAAAVHEILYVSINLCSYAFS